MLTSLPLGVYPGWVVAAQADGLVWPGGAPSLRILNVHAPTLPGPNSYVPALHEVLDDVVSRHGTHGWLIGGDFNLSTFGPEYFKPSKRRAEQEVIDRLANEFGLASAWERKHGRGSWPQTLRWDTDRTIPFHCDFLFVPKAWQQHLRSCDVLAEPGWTPLSDHNPVMATFT